MSGINISADTLQSKVQRPKPLTLFTRATYFPQLVTEPSFDYYEVQKPLKKGEHGLDTHCLRTGRGQCTNAVNRMQWYCPSCSGFACRWRDRHRHARKCAEAQQQVLDNLVEELFNMELDTSLAPVSEFDLAIASLQDSDLQAAYGHPSLSSRPMASL